MSNDIEKLTTNSFGPARFQSRFLASRFFLKSFLTSALILIAIYIHGSNKLPIGTIDSRLSLCKKVKEWQAQYPIDSRIRIAQIEAQITTGIGNILAKNGVIGVPVAINLPDIQEILDVFSQPQAVKLRDIDNIRHIFWQHSGNWHQSANYSALALVRFADSPSRETQSIIDELRIAYSKSEIDKNAKDNFLIGREIQSCSAMRDYLSRIDPKLPAIDRFFSALNELKAKLSANPNYVHSDDNYNRDNQESSSISCNLIPNGPFTLSDIQELAVLIAQELKINALGFSSASEELKYLIGIQGIGSKWYFISLKPESSNSIEINPIENALLSFQPMRGDCNLCDSKFEPPVAKLYKIWGVDSLPLGLSESGKTTLNKEDPANSKNIGITNTNSYSIQGALDVFCS